MHVNSNMLNYNCLDVTEIPRLLELIGVEICEKFVSNDIVNVSFV